MQEAAPSMRPGRRCMSNVDCDMRQVSRTRTKEISKCTAIAECWPCAD
jgi:hypothetical protein